MSSPTPLSSPIFLSSPLPSASIATAAARNLFHPLPDDVHKGVQRYLTVCAMDSIKISISTNKKRKR